MGILDDFFVHPRSIFLGMLKLRYTHKISRVFFTVWKGFMVLLHGIIKKSQKTPKDDLDLAKKRRKDVLKGGLEDEK